MSKGKNSGGGMPATRFRTPGVIKYLYIDLMTETCRRVATRERWWERSRGGGRVRGVFVSWSELV